MVDPVEINDAFRDYYKELYDTINETNVQDLNRFLDDLAISSIPNEQKEDMDLEINKEEIGHVIDSMKPRKSAGPGGLPIDLHKKM